MSSGLSGLSTASVCVERVHNDHELIGRLGSAQDPSVPKFMRASDGDARGRNTCPFKLHRRLTSLKSVPNMGRPLIDAAREPIVFDHVSGARTKHAVGDAHDVCCDLNSSG